MSSSTSSVTRELLTAYLDAHLATSTPAPSASVTAQRHVHFRVGPFQFLLAAAALGEARGGERPSRVQASELVPARYRDRFEPGRTTGPDVLVLKGGRIEIAGCLRCGEIDVPGAAITARGLRPESPWILGSVQQPPCFVLDSDALQLHFGRRAGDPA